MEFYKNPFFKVASLGSFIGCLLSSGCGFHSKEPQDYVNQAANPTALTEMPGELESMVLSVTNGTTDSCDQENIQKKLLIARTLDRSSPLLRTLQERQAQANGYRITTLGPLQVREPLAAPDSSDYPWTHETFGWDDIIRKYEDIKNDNQNVGWIKLSRDVRDILELDEKRIVQKIPLFDHEDRAQITELKDTLNRCAANTACNQVSIYRTEAMAPYASALNEIQNTASTTARKQLIVNLSQIVERDYNRQYFFKRTAAVSRTNSQELALTLDAGPFTRVRDRLKQIIESKWSSPQLSVKIIWTTPQQTTAATSDLTLFTFVANPQAIGKTFIDRTNATIHLSSDISLSNIAHEIGHVLGFNDNHFSPWYHERCAYDRQKKNSDIMSDPLNGQVTDAHWAELDRNYFRQIRSSSN